MAGPIYKFWKSKYTESWYQLSEAEKNAHNARVVEALKNVGGKTILICTPAWSTEEWLACGVEEFPDVDALQNHAMLLYQMGHFRYIQSTSMLAVNLPPM
jgi:hypothetical protein